MGLVQNLKKTLNNWVDKILVELSCHYIKHLAKQTSKKQDNCSSTGYSPNHLTTVSQDTTIATSSAGTSEKTTMMETEELVSNIREWALSRVGDIHEEIAQNKHDSGQSDDAYSIYQEFAEWIEPEPENTELEVVSLDEITEDQYNDFTDYMNDGIERG